MNKPDPLKYSQEFGLGTGPMSVEPCISEEYFEREREILFKHAWLCAGREDEIPNVGDYMVKDIEILQTSIIITRGKDNKVRAFHNICPHRLNKVMEPGQGNTKGFMCQFHGWTFDLEGKLAHCTNKALFSEFDQSKHGLPQLSADLWEGFIFINHDTNPKDDLATWVGDYAEMYAGYFDDKSLHGRWSVTVNCNWKNFIDAITEAYHAPTFHRHSLRDSFASPDNPNCSFNAVELHGAHRLGSVYANPGYVPMPIEGKTFGYAATPLYPATAETTASLPPGVNPSKNPAWAFDVSVLFPTMQMATASGWYLLMMYWPISVNQTRFDVSFYCYEAETAGDLIAQEYPAIHQRDVIREDMSTLEGTQQMMESGVLTEMVLCDEEITVRHNHKSVDDYLNENS